MNITNRLNKLLTNYSRINELKQIVFPVYSNEYEVMKSELKRNGFRLFSWIKKFKKSYNYSNTLLIKPFGSNKEQDWEINGKHVTISELWDFHHILYV